MMSVSNEQLGYGLYGSAGLVPPWQFYPPATVDQQNVPGVGNLKSLPHVSDKDVKVLKRKHANRESARRSKLRKKQEAEELNEKIMLLGQEHEALEAQVEVLHVRLASLRKANHELRLEIVQLGGDPDKYPEPQEDGQVDAGSEEIRCDESCESSLSQG